MTKEEIEKVKEKVFQLFSYDNPSEIDDLFNLIDQLQQENEKLQKSNDSRLRVIKELRKENDDLCTEISEMEEAEKERFDLEYEEFLGEDY